MLTFKGICSHGPVPEDIVISSLSEKDYKRLLRIRLSRKIDANSNMFFCPNPKCEKEVLRIGK
jgi:hypothetical protein